MSKYTQNSKHRRKSRRRSFRLSPLLLVLGGLVIVGGALFAVWISGKPANTKVPVEVNGSPSLQVDKEQVDLGDVPLDQTVSVSFLLTNVGDETLQFGPEPFVEVVEGC